MLFLKNMLHALVRNHGLALLLSLCTLGVLVVLLAIFLIANPPPPKSVVMATGPEGGAYHELGQRYQAFFAKRGIDLQLLPTKGAEENAERLLKSQTGSQFDSQPASQPGSPEKIDVAFVQSGLINPETASHLQTLGSIEYEPIWIFYRGGKSNDDLRLLKDFAHKRIAIGEKGSGTYTEAQRLFSMNGLDVSSANFLTMPTHDAVDALLQGDIDAIFLIQGIDSMNVQRLVADPGLKLVNFVRAETYAQLIPYLKHLIVPMGRLDLKRNIPATDHHLIATTNELIVRDNLHPTIVTLLMQAAHEINGKESTFAKRGEFPSFQGSGISESEQASLYYEKGPPFLMNHLPFWLAEFIHRTVFFLLPILVIALPLLRYIPILWEQGIRERINVIYTDIEDLEQELTASYDPTRTAEYMARLDRIEHAALKISHSRQQAQNYFNMRGHIQYVRDRLAEGKPYAVKYNDADGR